MKRETPSLQNALKDFNTVTTLNYRELQQRCKELQLNIKLNSKRELLEQALLEAVGATINEKLDERDYCCSYDYCNFFEARELSCNLEVNEFDKTGLTKQYEFLGAPVFYVLGQDYFWHELTLWLEHHEGAACDLVLQPMTRQQTVKQLVHGTKTYVECEPTVELASETFTLHELEEVVNEELAAPQVVVQTHDFLASKGWLVQPTHQEAETLTRQDSNPKLLEVVQGATQHPRFENATAVYSASSANDTTSSASSLLATYFVFVFVGFALSCLTPELVNTVQATLANLPFGALLATFLAVASNALALTRGSRLL